VFDVVFEKQKSRGTLGAEDDIPIWNHPWIQHGMALQPLVHVNIAFQNLKVADLLMSHDKCWNIPDKLCTVQHKSTRQVLKTPLFWHD